MLSHRTLRRRWGAVVTFVAMLLAVLGPGAGAAGATAVQSAPDHITLSDMNQPVRLMVQLAGAPVADGQSAASPALRAQAMQLEQQGFRSALRSAGIGYRELSAHSRLFNGLTIQVRRADVSRVARIKSVQAVYASRKVTLDLASSVKMIGADKAWAGDSARHIPGVDGSGVTVAVIDTGRAASHRT